MDEAMRRKIDRTLDVTIYRCRYTVDWGRCEMDVYAAYCRKLRRLGLTMPSTCHG